NDILIWKNFIPENTAGKRRRKILITNSIGALAAIENRVYSVPSQFCSVIIVAQIVVGQFATKTNWRTGQKPGAGRTDVVSGLRAFKIVNIHSGFAAKV